MHGLVNFMGVVPSKFGICLDHHKLTKYYMAWIVLLLLTRGQCLCHKIVFLRHL